MLEASRRESGGRPPGSSVMVEEIDRKAMVGDLRGHEIVAGQGCNGQLAQPAEFSSVGQIVVRFHGLRRTLAARL